MKKFLSLLLAAMMLLSCIPALAEEGTFTANAAKYMITAYKGTDENLVVPASVDGVPTPIINWQTINGAKKAVTLTLEEGITQIRSNNIASLNITQLTLPSTLEVIANNNIYQTDKLTEVTVPAAVSYVGTLTFSYCDVLTKVTFTGLCPVFGPRTFVSTAKDLVVYVPDDQLDAYKAALPEGLNIQSSGKNAVDARVRVSESDFEFDAATGTIKKYNGTASYIEIPATIGGVQVKTIGQKAFYQHPYMTVVIIPEGVETLEMYSIFAGSGLYRVELPSTLKTIGNNALWGAELDSVKLPEGLEKIGDGAFTNGMYSKVEELIIPDSVTSIGKEAFKGCTPIKIIIGANVQSLSEGAFGALNYVEEVVIRNTNGMTIDPKAFQSSKKGATITLMDGITEEVYNSYVEQLTVAYADATVNQPELAVPFPALDAEAGAPFIGNWTAVAVTDGTDFYGMDLLGMSMNVVLNDDGTGTVDMDGDAISGGWYVENGEAIFAPILEEGGHPVPEEAMPFTLDENSRMCLDLGGLIMLMEKEGAEYAVPAIPEKPWPELNQENAKNFIGIWEAVSYIMDGETYSAELMGKMMLTLNTNGTAVSVEPGEEPYELKWYADYGTAYVGPVMSALAKITFDGTGNIMMQQDGATIIMAPYVEPTPVPTPVPTPEPTINPTAGGEHLLGTWYDDLGNKLVLSADGAMDYTYASDGWTYNEKWAVVDGTAVVTEGRWAGADIYTRDGIVFIDNDVGIFQLFSADGDLSAYYGDDDEEDYGMPEAQPIGAEGEPYFGIWKADMYGIEVTLTMNADGTCALEMLGEADTAVWAVVDGKANIMGDEIYINSDGNLVYNAQFMVFTKAGDAEQAPAADTEIDYVPSVADDFIGGWICADDPTMQILLLENEANLIEGSECYTTTWAVVNGAAEFDGMTLYITDTYTIGILDMYGEQVKFERGYVEKPKASTSAPADSDDEMSDEELLALLALLAQLEGTEQQTEQTGLSEELKPYVGLWHMVYCETGTLKGDLRSKGLTGYLELNENGSGKLSGITTEFGSWYEDEGIVRFGESGFPLTMLEGGFLKYGTALSGYMVFSKDEAAVWNPDGAVNAAPAETPVPAPQAPAVPAKTTYVDQTFVLTKAETMYAGQAYPVDAAAFGEYKVRFNGNGSAELVQSGLALPAEYLTWKQNDQGEYVIDYVVNGIPIMNYVFIPVDGALTMDYYGTLMTFTPAE